MQQAPDMRFPAPEFEIKIVLAILLFGCYPWRRFRITRLILHPRLVGNPVSFPGLASIIGERLFKVRRIRVDVRPDVSNQNRSAIWAGWFLVEEFAAVVPEFADGGRTTHGAILAVGPIKAPLMSSEVVETQG